MSRAAHDPLPCWADAGSAVAAAARVRETTNARRMLKYPQFGPTRILPTAQPDQQGAGSRAAESARSAPCCAGFGEPPRGPRLLERRSGKASYKLTAAPISPCIPGFLLAAKLG